MVKKIILGLVLVLCAVAGHYVAKLQMTVDNTLNLMDREAGEDLSTVDLEGIEVASEDDIINILLVGADKRETWNEAGRSDSAMIATLDKKHKRLKLTSLMRDMYVTIPGYEEQNRINAAYSFGGVKLMYKTIAHNFGLKLDGYVVVDFAAFKKVINLLNGVDIELTEWEQKYLVYAYRNTDYMSDIVVGKNTLSGKQALAYTRIRQDASADFGRTARQRKVLASLFKKVKTMPMSKWLELAEEVSQCVATDLTNDEILGYMTDVMRMGTTEIDQMRIPVDDSFTDEVHREMKVLVPDLEKNTNELHDFIFNFDGEEKKTP